MLKKITLSSAALVAAVAAVPAAADAQRYGYSSGYYNGSPYARSYVHRDRYYGSRYSGYDNRYRGRSYTTRQSYRRCRSGTTGAIVGGAAGALLGREVAGRGDRTLGTIIGGVAGALGGRAITRDRYCR